MKILELRQARAKALHDARAIHTAAGTEKRDMSAEESANFDALMLKVDELAEQIKTASEEERDDDEEKKTAEERLAEAEAKEKEDKERSLQKRSAGRINPEGGDADHRASEKYAKAYRNWVRTGVQHRDLSMTTTAGGYLVTPTKLSKDLVIALNNMVFLRGLADIETLTEAASLGVPQITTDISDADWTSEVPSSLTADTALVTARRDLTPQFLCKLALISHKLLQFSGRAEQVVNERLGYKFGVAEEKAFLTGDGSGKPLGVFYASASGIPTSRDVACASQTTFTADELINLSMSIPQQYTKSKSFGWIMHRDSVKIARKLKDGEGRYVWQIGIGLDRPDTLLGYPLYQSEYAPNTFTTGLYVAALGDFRYYKIVDVANMEVQRLVERYADTNQVGFLGRRYVDGSPVLGAAFSRLKLA